MSNISANLDSGAVMARLGLLEKAIDPTLDLSAEDVSNEVLRLSQMEVPHDEGTLQNSGVVEKVDGDWVVGYHTAYAARLHEHPQYRFQKGRKGKYLEDPVLKNAQVLGLRFAKSVEKGLFGE